MKMKFTKMLAAGFFMAMGAGNLFAQEEQTFVFDPSDIDPPQDGYYVSGVTHEEDGFQNQCADYYGDSHHNETGEYGGFSYGNAMVMPTCEGKGTPPDNWPEGYIQLTKYKVVEEDEDQFGYIETPSVTDLESLRILVGTDNSIGSHRQIDMWIEASQDGGETWDELPLIVYTMTNQGGDEVVYEAGGESAGFDQLVEASQEGPIMLRIASALAPGDTDGVGDRLKIFRVELVATEAGGSGPGGPTSVADDFDTNPFFTVQNNTFVADQGKLSVYTITGIFVGSGSQVAIPSNGLYVVRSDKGKVVRIGIN